MPVIETSLEKESRDRYLTYALSVVSSRALPDVRDGLKPVQRRILYDMFKFLKLTPAGSYRKSAAVVGGVLARFHPHGDVACYEAMVRMAQDFSMRYTLVDGQGNFGSIDGDSAAAYRYTEAKLTPLAIEVIGEIDQETVPFRDNFDGTQVEPTVLPSKVPNLLVNGAMGIAVGMATSIPPHNLRDVTKALIDLLEDPEQSEAKLAATVKAPDFPTGCAVLNTTNELKEIYKTGRGSIRMRGEWKLEEGSRGKRFIIVTNVPYSLDKSQLIEKIASHIISRKLPQLVDVRDESTDEVRIVLELATDADPEVAMAYLYKNTPLESNFSVNMTALVPQKGIVTCKPELLSLKAMLQHFLDFRYEVVTARLEFEKRKLLERIHILEGFVTIFDDLDNVIKIVRKSAGRQDAAQQLQKKYKLTEIQSYAIVDMRIYQLSRTSIEDIRAELKAKLARVKEIDAILKSKKKLSDLIKSDLEEISEKFGDKRRSKIVKDVEEVEFDESDYIVKEEVYAIVTSDGWLKRIRQSNDPAGTRIREGDRISKVHTLSTLDWVAFFTNLGNLYTLKVADFPASSGYGSPVQKILKFKDGEKIVESFSVWAAESEDAQKELFEDDTSVLVDGDSVVLVTEKGMGYALTVNGLDSIKRNGKRVMKIRTGDNMAGASLLGPQMAFFTKKGSALCLKEKEIPVRENPAVGVILMSVRDGDSIVSCISGDKQKRLHVEMKGANPKEIKFSDVLSGKRALKGRKVVAKGEINSVEIL
ncbi:MAG: DNA topoisomerase 4 subunit A [Deltaproteobacteria bacterium]|nr:DNA topoisomerase 4 subunit A [Deltaproteobacteria bacterium]